MWCRYRLKCNHCGKITNLRLGIEGSPHQEIKFNCGNCKSIIGGVLEIDSNKNTFNLISKGCKIIQGNFNDGDYFVEYAEGLPVLQSRTEGHFILTPFIRMIAKYDEKWDIVQKLHYEQSIAEEDWIELENFNHAYLEKDFVLMKKISKKYKTFDEQILKNDIFINKILFEINFKFFLPFLNSMELEKYLKSIDNYLKHKDFDTNVIDFIHYLNKNDYINDWFVEIFDNITLFIEYRKKFRSMISCIPLTSGRQKIDNEIISTESFLSIKNIYTNIFETLGRLISICFGFDNIDERNNYNSINPYHKKKLKKWEDFFLIDNGKKMQYISNNPLWQTIMKNSYDNKLRNGINHNKARINTNTQIISYYPTKDGKKVYKISYFSFLIKTLESFSSLFYFLIFLLKLRDIYNEPVKK